MQTKPENGGALLHIIDALNYKLRTDLNEENEKKPDSIFIEIIQKNIKKFYNWLHLQVSMYASERIQWSFFKISNRKNY